MLEQFFHYMVFFPVVMAPGGTPKHIVDIATSYKKGSPNEGFHQL